MNRKILTILLALVLAPMLVFAGGKNIGWNNLNTEPSYNSRNSTTQTTTYTILTSDDEVRVTTSASDVTVTLPALSALNAAGFQTKGYKILKTDATEYDVVISPSTTADTINGQTSYRITNQNDFVTIYSDVTSNNWIVSYSDDIWETSVTEGGVVTGGTLRMIGATPIVYEGATDDGFETTITIADPSADRTITYPDSGGTITLNPLTTGWTLEGATADTFEAFFQVEDPTVDYYYELNNPTDTACAASGTACGMVTSSLKLNGQGAANSVNMAANVITFEGSAADASETTIVATNPTADIAWTLPDMATGTYGFMVSSLATNGIDIANSVWGVTNGLAFGGATGANTFEVTVSPGADPGADVAVTLPIASGGLVTQLGVSSYVGQETITATASGTLTTADCGKTIFLNHATVGIDITIPAVSGTAGCKYRIIHILATSDNHTILTTGGEDKIVVQSLIADGNAGITDDNADVIDFVDTADTVGDECTAESNGTLWYFKCIGSANGAFTSGTT